MHFKQTKRNRARQRATRCGALAVGHRRAPCARPRQGSAFRFPLSALHRSSDRSISFTRSRPTSTTDRRRRVARRRRTSTTSCSASRGCSPTVRIIDILHHRDSVRSFVFVFCWCALIVCCAQPIEHSRSRHTN
jgi:hypothetical protein